MREDLKKEIDEFILYKEFKKRKKQFVYSKISKSIKRNALFISIVTTGLGALLRNPTLMYFGASVYQVQTEF